MQYVLVPCTGTSTIHLCRYHIIAQQLSSSWYQVQCHSFVPVSYIITRQHSITWYRTREKVLGTRGTRYRYISFHRIITVLVVRYRRRIQIFFPFRVVSQSRIDSSVTNIPSYAYSSFDIVPLLTRIMVPSSLKLRAQELTRLCSNEINAWYGIVVILLYLHKNHLFHGTD